MVFIFRLLRLLLVGAIGYVLYRVLWKGEGWNFFRFNKSKKKSRRYSSRRPIAEMKKDPVCGTYIPENQAIRHRTNNNTHYFCSQKCKAQFIELQEKQER